MKEISSKLSEINKYWNNYYFSKEFFQKKINFNEEIKTNYYGDLNFYLHDTLGLIKEFDEIKDSEDYISKIIVLLQTIYTQQDLLDELLYIFKLPKSNSKDKNPNRQIRNELIGHPISRSKKNNELNSSILFDINNKSKDSINYTKYSKDNNFKTPLSQSYKVNEILDYHKFFLNKYLDLILKKMEQDKKEYRKKLKKIVQIPLYQQFKYIHQFDKYLLSNISYIFEKESLDYYYKNMRKHKRYLLCLKQYKKALNEVIFNIQDKTKYKQLIELYDREQLYKKDSIFTIDFYLDKYKNNNIVYVELLNMKNYLYDDREYYASLNFLCYQ